MGGDECVNCEPKSKLWDISFWGWDAPGFLLAVLLQLFRCTAARSSAYQGDNVARDPGLHELVYLLGVCAKMFTYCYAFAWFSMGKRPQWPNEKRQSNSKYELQRFVLFFNDFRSEQGTCGQSQRQQTHNKYDVLSCLTIFTGKKAPAAIADATKTKLTGLHRTSMEFNRFHRIALNFTIAIDSQWNCINIYSVRILWNLPGVCVFVSVWFVCVCNLLGNI